MKTYTLERTDDVTGEIIQRLTGLTADEVLAERGLDGVRVILEQMTMLDQAIQPKTRVIVTQPRRGCVFRVHADGHFDVITDDDQLLKRVPMRFVKEEPSS